MTLSRRTTPAGASDGDAILNALPNPVLLIGPDARSLTRIWPQESFFEISTQFLATAVAEGARAVRQSVCWR